MLSLRKQYYHYRTKILNQIYGHVTASIFIYTILKLVFRNTEQNFMLKLLTVLLSPVVFCTIWSLKLARGVVQLWLAFKEGDDFVQLLDGVDSTLMAIEKPNTRNIIAWLAVIEFNGDGPAFGQRVKDTITTAFSGERFLKLRCSVVQGLGYYYYKRSHWPINNHFKELSNDYHNGAMTMESLRKIISELSNAPMPCNDAALWEAHIGERPLEGSGKCVYPLFIRFHHVVGDGATIFNIFSGEFQNRFPPATVKVASMGARRSLDARYKKTPFITDRRFVCPLDNSVFYQTNGNKHVVWYTEEKPEMLNTIKEMKAQLKNNVTVTDIILTCFLESLENYFCKTCTGAKQDNKSYPNSISAEVPALPPNFNFNAYGLNNYKLNFQTSGVSLRLPLKLNANQNQQRLLTRLEIIRQEYDLVMNKSLDIMLARWVIKVLLTAPQFFLKWFMSKFGSTILVSNAPGCNSLKCFEGLKVKELLAIGPNVTPSGVTLAITSYEKRLSFAYTIDSAVIANVDDVKEIADNFTHNFNKLRDILNSNVKNC